MIQGDSLRILFDLVHTVALGVQAGSPDEECLGALDELHEAVLGRLLHYQEVLGEHGIQLPYGRPVSLADAVKCRSAEDA